MHLYSDNAQMTSKRGENKEVRYEPHGEEGVKLTSWCCPRSVVILCWKVLAKHLASTVRVNDETVMEISLNGKNLQTNFPIPSLRYPLRVEKKKYGDNVTKG